MTALLEVCVDTPEALAHAVANGANRIELCAALDNGGLTPSAGFMRRARAAGAPIHVLIRPRTGGFVYSPAELAVMAEDIVAARAAGMAGVVIGASRADHTIDWPAMQRLMHAAQGMHITLHRAFDLVPDQAAALDEAIEAGVGRVLTSGGAATALAGAPRIAALIRQAVGRIVVMPGGGIAPGNVARLIGATFATELHASCRTEMPVDARLVTLGFGQAWRLQPETVRAMIEAMAAG